MDLRVMLPVREVVMSLACHKNYVKVRFWPTAAEAEARRRPSESLSLEPTQFQSSSWKCAEQDRELHANKVRHLDAKRVLNFSKVFSAYSTVAPRKG